jgi:hypothetical protein
MASEQSGFLKWLKDFVTHPVVGFALLIITVVSLGGNGVQLWLQLRPAEPVETIPQKTEITARVVQADDLIEFEAVPGLEGSFAYEGDPVSYLWKVTVVFVNTGDTVIVFEGEQKNVVGDAIYFDFPEGTYFVGRSVTVSGFVLGYLGGIVVEAPSTIGLKRTQFRPGESIEVTCYIASDEPLESPPLPHPESEYDSIIDGRVQILDCTTG